MGGPQPGPSGWAHAGPKWVGPRGAQVGGPTRGPSGPTWGPSGPKPEIWDPKKSKKQKFSKSKSVLPKMSAIFFMPEKGVPAPFGALPAHFLRGPEKSKNCPNFAYFPWWAHGPYSPGLGPLLLSTRGGAIGNLMWDFWGTNRLVSLLFLGTAVRGEKDSTYCPTSGG